MKKLIKSVIRWFVTTRALPFPRSIISVVLDYAILAKNGTILYYEGRERADVVDLIKRVKDEVKSYITINEAYQIFMAVKNTGKIKGDIAEVGVFRGGSAKIICEAKENK